MQDKVTAKVKSLGYDRDQDGWDHNLYSVTLRYQRRSMTTKFRTGLGWDHPPTAADVLESMLSDASSADQGFGEWAADYGYGEDDSLSGYRKAKKIYKAVQSQTDRLRNLLGDEYESAVFPQDESSEEVSERLTGLSAVES